MKDGKVVVPGGVEYEMLVLPDEDTMSEKVVRRVGELLDAGARVVAQRRPARAPGLKGRNGKTARVQQQDCIDIEIKVTNRWPNRLIGDDILYPDDCEWESRWFGWQKINELGIKEIPQWVKNGKRSPTGRHTFTTWKHWTKKDKLIPSGLLGPVRVSP